MQFLFQPLTWGFFLVAVPILVHLINMLRHRKQPWAAMDFLLESYRRNRRWVMLKQWLLLASRILIMLLLVAMLAKWVSAAKWLSWFGGQTTHHYVLLDDSYSMSEVEQNETCYNRGLKALNGLVRSIANQPGQHQITLVRWSRAQLASKNTAARVDTAADLMAQTIPRDPTRLLDRLSATQPTSLQLTPDATLDLISPMIAQGTGEQAEVYLLSDLRRNEWGEPEALRIKLQALTTGGAKVQLIDCGRESTNNLTIAMVEPEQEVWAAGVPLIVRFQIRNQSAQPARNVVVKIRTLSYAQGVTKPAAELPYSGQNEELPSVVIEQIAAGETVTRQVQVLFGLPGQHVVEITLPEDPLEIDNRRWCVIEIQQSQRVLLVDGAVDQSNAFFLKTALNPDAKLATGMTLETVDASYLRDVPEEQLATWSAVALLDVPRLDVQAIDKLERYCASGGGVFICVGPNTNIKTLNDQLYRQGNGLLPTLMTGITEVEQPLGDGPPQVTASEHQILAPLTKLSSSPFFMTRIRQIITLDEKNFPPSGTEIVATGPGKRPLILDKAVGEGHAVTLLTGLNSAWSNWSADPTFVVFALRSMGYLGSFRHKATSGTVGSDLEMVVTGQAVLPEAEVLIPSKDAGSRIRLQPKVQTNDAGDVSKVKLSVDLDQANRDLIDDLLRPGLFESWMVAANGDYLVDNAAHNVSASEGDLTRVSENELESKLPVKVRTAESLAGLGLSSQDAAHSTLLMTLLALLLLGEQALAYSASFHPQRLAAGASR
jgi:Aerotolerance regulator N-terminal